MKFFQLTGIVAIALLQGVHGNDANTSLRGTSNENERVLHYKDSSSSDYHLDYKDSSDYHLEYGFLISHIHDHDYWCITATNGVKKGKKVGFTPCNFHDAPRKELWAIDSVGRIHSKLDPHRCMIVDHGTHVKAGTRIRIDDCNTLSHLTHFLHDGKTDTIQVRPNDKFCITNSGADPDKSDDMLTQRCKSEGKFIFTFKSEHDYSSSDSKSSKHKSSSDYHSKTSNDHSKTSYDGSKSSSHHSHSSSDYSHSSSYYYRHHKYDYHLFYSASPAKFNPRYKKACLGVKNDKVKHGQSLMLRGCHFGRGWRLDKHGLLHSQLNDHYCMQADHNGPKVGGHMRLFKCDKDEKLQRFEYKNDKMRLKGTDYCVNFTGTKGDVDKDTIILKKCNDNDRTDLWVPFTDRYH